MNFHDFHGNYLAKAERPRYIPADFRIYDQDAFIKWFLAVWPDHESEYSGTILGVWDAYINGWNAGCHSPNREPHPVSGMTKCR